MKLYYFKDRYGNFGDDLNPWLWENLFPGVLNQSGQDLFIGVGTLLNHRIPPAPSITVFGSGHGYGSLPKISPKWKFYCVRGPLTASSLGLSNKLAITDPASLVPLFYAAREKNVYPVSFMPHCESCRLGDWAHVCEQAGIKYLDPQKPFLEVFADISRTELLLTEAMHGAILADSFRVPWIPIKAYDHISEYKWRDWLQSVQLDAEFCRLPSIWRGDDCSEIGVRWKNKLKRGLMKTALWQDAWQVPPPVKSNRRQIDEVVSSLNRIVASAHPKLSAKQVFDDNTSRLMETVDRFKTDFHV